jgi:hypothetical protein
MSVEADFHEAKGIIQAAPTVAWIWEMGDLNRFMAYSVVPGQANQALGGRTSSARALNRARRVRVACDAMVVARWACRTPRERDALRRRAGFRILAQCIAEAVDARAD